MTTLTSGMYPRAGLPVLAALLFTTTILAAEPIPPALRTDHYGDPLPDEAISRLGTVRLRHGVLGYSLHFTPDGKTLLSQGRDGVRMWNASTGKQIHFVPHEWSSATWDGTSLSWDGKLLAVPGKSGADIWEVDSGKRLRVAGTGDFSIVRFSPDGKTLATQDDSNGQIALWDATTGQQIHTGRWKEYPFASLAFTADGKTLVTGPGPQNSDPNVPEHNKVRLWNAANAEEKLAFDVGANRLETVVPSPDGKLLAASSWGKDKGARGAIHIWDMASGKEIRRIELKPRDKSNVRWSTLTAMVFSPDGKTLFTGGHEDALIAWDPVTGEELRRFGHDVFPLRAMALTSDGKTAAIALPGNRIRLIDTTDGKERFPEVGHDQGINHAVVTPDGRTVVTAGAREILVWKSATGREVHRFGWGLGSFVGGIHLLGDGNTLLAPVADLTHPATLHAWDLMTGKEARNIEWKENQYLLACAPDGKTIALKGKGATIVLMDLNAGKELHNLKSESQWIFGGAFTSDSRTLITLSDDEHQIHFRDVATGRETRKISFENAREYAVVGRADEHPKFSYTAEVSSDGRTIACSHGKNALTLYDLATGKIIRKIDNLPDDVSATAISPDCKTLAWGDYKRAAVHLVEVNSGRERHSFAGQHSNVRVLTFSPDGTLLIAGSEDTTVMVWDLTGRLREKETWGKPLTREQLDANWSDLSGVDASRAYRAIRKLAGSPNDALPYLRQRLQPPPIVDEKRVAKLIADLNGEDFNARETATKELETFAEGAVGLYRKALDSQLPPETRRRLEVLVEKHAEPWRNPSPERLLSLRCLEVLERIRTPEARQVLEALAKGASGARLTEEAKGALERLNRGRK